MTTYVYANQTYHLHGVLATSERLTALPGGLIEVRSGATNEGVISLYGTSYGGAADSARLLIDGQLSNGGSIRIDGGALGGQDAPAGAALINDGVLLNTGQISVGGGHTAYYDPADQPGLLDDDGFMRNAGLLTVFGFYQGYYPQRDGTTPGQVDVNGVLINSGTIALRQGQFAGSGATLAIAGTLTNLAGGQITGPAVRGGGGGVLSVAAGGTLNNAGLLTMTPGYDVAGRSTLAVAGVLNNAGTLQLLGGLDSGYQSGGAYAQIGGALTNAGLLSIGGASGTAVGGAGGATLAAAGVLSNAGVIDIGAGGAPGGDGGLLLDRGRLSNHATGVITLDGGQSGAGGGLLSITAAGSLSDAGAITGAGTLVNEGTIGSGGAGVTSGTIAVAQVQNDGVIEVAPRGALTIGGDVTAGPGEQGGLRIAASSTLTLSGTVAASQTVSFGGNDGTLGIGDANQFAAVLDLALPRMTIDFLARDVTDASASGTVLAVAFGNGHVLDYTLAAPLLAGTVIDLRADGHQGTDLVFHGGAEAGAGGGVTGGGVALGGLDGADAARQHTDVALFLHSF